ncbi:MAG TPA: hypothetical protein VFT22_17340 [Kofleriaceae bacterium]|nr:hypothetical protein [Kofleriaceae bacterium]
MKMKRHPYNASQRAMEKALSRDIDAQALESGTKSAAQLRSENGAFAFPRERVQVDFSRAKPKR